MEKLKVSFFFSFSRGTPSSSIFLRRFRQRFSLIESSLDRACDRNIFISFILSLFSVLFAITRLTAAGFSSVTRSVLGFFLSLLNVPRLLNWTIFGLTPMVPKIPKF